jgi:hypothetical protein
MKKLILVFSLCFGILYSQSDTLIMSPHGFAFDNAGIVLTGNIGDIAYQFDLPGEYDTFSLREILVGYANGDYIEDLEFTISIGAVPGETLLQTLETEVTPQTPKYPVFSSISLDPPLRIERQTHFFVGGLGLQFIAHKVDFDESDYLWSYDVGEFEWSSSSGYFAVKLVGELDFVSISDPAAKPVTFELSQNYPNPFNPSTTIAYQLPMQGDVSFTVFDVSGRKVHAKTFSNQPVGSHSISFNAENLSSGVYFYQLKVGETAQTKRMVLMK